MSNRINPIVTPRGVITISDPPWSFHLFNTTLHLVYAPLRLKAEFAPREVRGGGDEDLPSEFRLPEHEVGLEDILGNRGVGFKKQRLRPVGEGDLPEEPLNSHRDGILAEDPSASAARGAAPGEHRADVGASSFARDLYKSELRDAKNARAVSVGLEDLLQPSEQAGTVLFKVHVDEVDDDDAADGPEPELTRNFRRSFKIRLQDGMAKIRLADILTGVDVDNGQRLCVVDDQVSARLQPHLAFEGGVDLLLHSVVLEERDCSLVQRKLRGFAPAQARKVTADVLELFGAGVLITLPLLYAAGALRLVSPWALRLWVLLPFLPLPFLGEGKRALWVEAKRFLHRPLWVGILILPAFLYAALPPTFYDTLVYHLAVPNHILLHHGFVATPNWLYSNSSNFYEVLLLLPLSLGERVPGLFHFFLGVLFLLTVVDFGRKELRLERGYLPLLLLTFPMTLFLLGSLKNDLPAALFLFLAFRALRKGRWERGGLAGARRTAWAYGGCERSQGDEEAEMTTRLAVVVALVALAGVWMVATSPPANAGTIPPASAATNIHSPTASTGRVQPRRQMLAMNRPNANRAMSTNR